MFSSEKPSLQIDKEQHDLTQQEILLQEHNLLLQKLKEAQKKREELQQKIVLAKRKHEEGVVKLLSLDIHNTKILFAKLLGLSVSESGICHGDSWVAAFLVLANQANKIFEFQQLIPKIVTPIHIEMNELEIKDCNDLKISESIQKLRATVPAELKNQITLIAKLQDVSLLKEHDTQELDNQQDILKLLPYLDIHNLTLENKPLADEKNVAIEIDKFTVSYTMAEQLVDIFSPLKTLLDKNKNNESFALILQSIGVEVKAGHAITVSFVDNAWIFVNANNPPESISDIKMLAKKIAESFNVNAFTIKMLAKTSSKPQITKLFDEWYTACSAIAVRGDLQTTLSVALSKDDINTVKKLYSKMSEADKIKSLKDAINSEHIEIAEFLLDYITEIDFNKRKYWSITLLSTCIKNNKMQLFASISKKLSLNIDDVLQWECSHKSKPSLIKKLITHKANPFFIPDQKIPNWIYLSEASEENRTTIQDSAFDHAVRAALKTNKWSTVKILHPEANIEAIKNTYKKIRVLNHFIYNHGYKCRGQLITHYINLKLTLKRQGKFYSDDSVRNLMDLIEDFSHHHSRTGFKKIVTFSFNFFRSPETYQAFQQKVLRHKDFVGFNRSSFDERRKLHQVNYRKAIS